MEALAPQIAGLPLTEKLAVRFEPMGRPRGTVGLFTGCVMDQTMGNTHRATVRLLTRHGYSVQVIPDQTCCGALHVHNGAPDRARTLLLQNARAFESAGVERIVVNSAGCGAQLREAPALFRGEDRSVVQKMASSSVDFTSFLVEIGFQPPSPDPTTGRVRRRVVYDAPCHLHHAQKVQEAPLELLGALTGVEVLPLDESDMCCGAAGIYNLLQPTLSARLLDRKLDRILASGADTVLTANPGCLIQIDAGLRARSSTIEVLHLADFLDAAYAPRDSSSDRPAWSGKRPISQRDPPR
jgi:glycolate oxidase iron-sulfur subunit